MSTKNDPAQAAKNAERDLADLEAKDHADFLHPRAPSNDAPAAAAQPATPSSPASAIDEPPPFLGSWRNIYLLVLGELAVLVIAFSALTRWAS